MISQTLINKAISRHDAGLLPTFCILREKVEDLITHTCRSCYKVVSAPNAKDCLEVSKKTARELIELHNLVEQLRTEDGSVYDSPDMAFRRKYKGAHVPNCL